MSNYVSVYLCFIYLFDRNNVYSNCVSCSIQYTSGGSIIFFVKNNFIISRLELVNFLYPIAILFCSIVSILG